MPFEKRVVSPEIMAKMPSEKDAKTKLFFKVVGLIGTALIIYALTQ